MKKEHEMNVKDMKSKKENVLFRPTYPLMKTNSAHVMRKLKR